MAYFSSDFAINCCETIEQFSSNPALSLEELIRYFSGGFNPTPGWYFYPLAFYVKQNTVILNLTASDAPFFQNVSVRVGQSLTAELWNVTKSRDAEAKRCTQVISVKAHKVGFDGIAYTSVRSPVDVAMPDRNLVMFNSSKVTSVRPPNSVRFEQTAEQYRSERK